MDSLKQAATCIHLPMMSLCVWTFFKNNNNKKNQLRLNPSSNFQFPYPKMVPQRIIFFQIFQRRGLK